MSKKEREQKIQEFWEYLAPTQGTITIVDPKVMD